MYEAAASKIEEDRISVRFAQTFHPLERTSEYVNDQFLQNEKSTPHAALKPNEAPADSTFNQLKQEVEMPDPRSPYTLLPCKNNANDRASQLPKSFAVHEQPQ